MARSIETIFAEIEAAKNADPNLAGLNSPSATAVWRLWGFVTAGSIWALEKLFDLHKAEVEAIAAAAVPGTTVWYRNRALEYQWSDSTSHFIIVGDDGKPVYQTVVEADRIVKFAAVVESTFSRLVVKVAKETGGIPGPLTAPELTSFRDYMQAVKFAGTRLQCISAPADKMRLYAEIVYDPIANPVALAATVEAAVNAFLRALPFNGLIYAERLTDALQAVPGVVDVRLTEVVFDPGGVTLYRLSSGSNVRFYQTFAGYATVDPAFPLVDTLTYTPSDI